jgi:hypothetical protein
MRREQVGFCGTSISSIHPHDQNSVCEVTSREIESTENRWTVSDPHFTIILWPWSILACWADWDARCVIGKPCGPWTMLWGIPIQQRGAEESRHDPDGFVQNWYTPKIPWWINIFPMKIGISVRHTQKSCSISHCFPSPINPIIS